MTGQRRYGSGCRTALHAAGKPAGALAGDGAHSLATDSPTRSLHELTSWAVEHDIELEELTVTHPTLEDLFIELVGETSGSGE